MKYIFKYVIVYMKRIDSLKKFFIYKSDILSSKGESNEKHARKDII